MNYCLIALIVVWLLGMPTHYSEWDHMPFARLWAVFWPLAIVISLVLSVAAWLWDLVGFRVRWASKWPVEPRFVKHIGWSKGYRMYGIFKFGDPSYDRSKPLAPGDEWYFRGLAKGSWILGRVIKTMESQG